MDRLEAHGYISAAYVDSIESWVVPLGENASTSAPRIEPLE